MAYVFVGAAGCAWAWAQRSDFVADARAVIASVDASEGRGNVFQRGSAFLVIAHGRGYALTVCVRGHPDARGAEFLTFKWRPGDGCVVEELLSARGNRGPLERVHRGVAAEDVLERYGLARAPFDGLYRLWYSS
ncbi:MAG: hypothetical protein D6731_10920 [Planctomycetota bacterium]|nr:MAG: hypothetical protein D6731_10920 [Planctomycetota bacterium]